MLPRIPWPDGKRFAFTVFDDTDKDWLHNVKPVYAFLRDLGIFTTKSAWILEPEYCVPLGGEHCANPEYRAWIQQLQREGFEIGFHNVRHHSSPREKTLEGLERFKDYFNHYPRTMSNHSTNEEDIYWGANRLDAPYRWIYQVAQIRNGGELAFSGHIEGSKYFWGDRCRQHIQYVRNFVFREINTLKVCPFMPYHDPRRPYVNAWYASAEGGNMPHFNELLCEANQDQLAEEGGACIVYTHFGKAFYDEKSRTLEPRFVELMKRLAGLGGWFVPVGTLLDYLKERNGGILQLNYRQRNHLQWQWLKAKLKYGSS